jgi:PAS domain S-box-containing protein
MVAPAERPALRVLLIEDDEDDYVLTRELFAEMRGPPTEIEWVQTYEAGLAALQRAGTDVCLLDYRLGARDGLALLEEARRAGSRVPVIVLTGQGQGDTDITALKRGADDFLSKSELRATGLSRAVRYAHERGRHHEDLRASEQRYRRIIETTTEGVWVIDADGKTTLTNARLEKMVGCAPEELVGRPLTSFFAGEDLALPAAALELRRHGVAEQRECRLRRADGSEVWVCVSATPLFDASGAYEGALAMVTDISARKRVEVELELHRDHLEKLVAERTADLEIRNSELVGAREELTRARDQALAASRAKGAFLANMSHEIRTPMNAIQGFAQLLRRDPTLGPAQVRDLDTILRSGEHLLALINDILEISRIEAGRVELHAEPVDVRGLLGEVERLFRLLTEAKGLVLHVEHGSAVPRWVLTDAAKLRQVLVNLVGNAVKFTARGGVFVSIDFATEPSRLRVEVRDTGAGISEADQARIFRPFEQTRSGERAGGTGLGLAISREFVRLLGGDLRVKSALGEGATFSFDVLTEASECGDVASAPGSRRVDSLASLQPRFRVLVVDDGVADRELLTRFLAPLGFEVRLAADGERAVALTTEWRPHIVLMDLRMPGVSGVDAIRAMRALPGGRDLVIIAVTARAFAEDRAEVLKAGGDGFLVKPFREADLFDELRKHAGLQYVYADPCEAPAPHARLERAALVAVLPPDLLRRLHRATVTGDLASLIALLQDAEPLAPAMIAELRSLAEQFDYETLLGLFQPSAT